MVRYIQSKLVSEQWYVVLQAASDAGIAFQLNSGRRTMRQQQKLVDEKGVWTPSNPTGAALPTPNAPHIRVGREDHALDVSTLDGGNSRLTAWLRSEGVRVNHPIQAEPWHLEVPGKDLERLYLRYRRTAGFPNPERRWMREYDRLLRLRKDRPRRTSLRRAMKGARKKYFGVAKDTKLYAALLIRSR
jgi:hypothetical protein